MAIQRRENDLVLGTHGRSVYVLDDYSALRGLDAGDFDGDGLEDVVVANENSDNVTYLRQRYLQPHATALFSPGEVFPMLLEPRNPHRFLKYCLFTPCVFLMLCLSLEGLSPGSRGKVMDVLQRQISFSVLCRISPGGNLPGTFQEIRHFPGIFF